METIELPENRRSTSSAKFVGLTCSMKALKIGILSPVTPARTVIHSKKLKWRWLVGAWNTKPNVTARPVRIQSYVMPLSEEEALLLPSSSSLNATWGTICATASPVPHKIDPVTIFVGTGLASKCPSYHSMNETDLDPEDGGGGGGGVDAGLEAAADSVETLDADDDALLENAGR